MLFIAVASFPVIVVLAACYDLITMTIPNLISLALVASFAVLALVLTPGWAIIGWHFAVGFGVLVLTFALFAFRLLGGGDAKLAAALKRGPGVLYFFPKAFTQGCTLEAHAFAEATPQFAAMKATVVGMSHDDIDTLKRFSTEACRDQFAVASDPRAVTIKAYDAGAAANPARADRISYVVGQDGKVKFALVSSDPLAHVEQTKAAVRQMQGK